MSLQEIFSHPVYFFCLSGGKIGVMDAIVGQTLGGTLFSLLAGQPLIVIMTTAPIALYIKIIVAVAEVDKFFTGRTNDYEYGFYRSTTWTSTLCTRVLVSGMLFT